MIKRKSDAVVRKQPVIVDANRMVNNNVTYLRIYAFSDIVFLLP